MKKIAFLLFVLWAEIASGQVTYPPVTIAFPHVVAGGDPNGPHYITLLQIVNNNSASITAHVALFSDSGSPVAVLFDDQGPRARSISKWMAARAGKYKSVSAARSPPA